MNRDISEEKKLNRLMYAAAFFIPVAICLLIYLASDIWPLGTRCFLKTDLYHQYAPFTQELRNKLLHGGSLFYTWDIGLGVNFLALFAYYLSSPENFLAVLVPHDNVIEFMMVCTIIKIGLAGLSMTKYLKYKNGGKPDPGLAVFGIFYALSGYVCAYYWNVMWMDCVVLFPAVIYGAEALIREKKIFPYAMALGLCILTNYYIAIMICLFLIGYFVMLNFLYVPADGKDFLARGLRFAAGSLIAGAFAAVLLIPEAYALSFTASGSSSFPKSWQEYFTIPEMLTRMLPAVKTEQQLDHWPNIYAGSQALVLLPLFFSSHRIKAREKAVYAAALLFLLASFSLNIPNYIWHGLHFPNSLPARQSFLYVFLVLVMGFRAWQFRKSFSAKETGACLAIAAAFILAAQYIREEDYVPFYSAYLALAACGLLVLVFRLEKKKKLGRLSASALVLILCLAEVTVNTCTTSLSVSDRVFFLNDGNDAMDLAQEVMKERTGLSRFNKEVSRTKNDGAWLGIPTVSIFSSVADAKMTELMKKLGCEGSTNSYSINGSTPFTEMLLGVRYDIKDVKEEDTSARKFVSLSGDTFLFENTDTLELGFMLPSALTEQKIYEDNYTPQKVQNAMSRALGAGSVLVEDAGASMGKGKRVSAFVSEDGEYFAYVTNSKLKKVKVTTPDDSRTAENLDRKYLIALGNLKKGDEVKFESATDGEDVTAVICRFDSEALEKAYEVIGQEQFVTESISDTKITGTVCADPEALGYAGREAILCFTIPYDKGWKVTVDGSPVETERVLNDALLGVRMGPGLHRVEMTYVPVGFVPGALLSLGSVLLLILLALRENGKVPFPRKKKKAEIPEENA
ncbi:MAG: YfhO family protein [Eubacteriales bacterium]|nr:YfhO family protein [Eubacteriales bacterium]